MSERKKIYISGKITGDKNAEAKFRAAESFLIKTGYDPINPFKIPVHRSISSPRWIDYLKADLLEMLKHNCEKIYLLHDWNYSDGAKVEVCLAEKFEYEIIRQKHSFNG